MDERNCLFVDDEWNAYEIWGKPLERFGWRVTYASGRDEALALLNTRTFHVAIIDRQMKDPVTGYLRENVGDELLEEIVAGWRDVCPIMLTSIPNLDAV